MIGHRSLAGGSVRCSKCNQPANQQCKRTLCKSCCHASVEQANKDGVTIVHCSAHDPARALKAARKVPTSSQSSTSGPVHVPQPPTNALSQVPLVPTMSVPSSSLTTCEDPPSTSTDMVGGTLPSFASVHTHSGQHAEPMSTRVDIHNSWYLEFQKAHG